MTQNEFANAVCDAMKRRGYSHVRVNTALFAKKADVVARDKYGNRLFFKARYENGEISVTSDDDTEFLIMMDEMDL